MRQDLHQPFRIELQQRFADRNAADAELLRQRVLTQLCACAEFSVEDAAPQRVNDGGCNRAMAQPLADRGAFGLDTRWWQMHAARFPAAA
jgi:hypothetical protein